jgi:hypothetical protein
MFSSVLKPTDDQRTTYEVVMQNKIYKILSGFGSSLTIGYGVTNSGKTYTMTG